MQSEVKEEAKVNKISGFFGKLRKNGRELFRSRELQV